MFDEKATAHMAVYLLLKNGGPMSHIKLMKLMYLSERTALKNFATPITCDRFVSMQYGPVLSTTLGHMNGYIKSQPGGWADCISARANHQLSVKDSVTESGDELGHLSKADRIAIDQVWKEFGEMEPFQIVDYTHDHCPEWEDPHGSSFPIPIERVLLAVGYNDNQVKAIAERIKEEESIGGFSEQQHGR